MVFLSTVASLTQVKAGKERALGISGRERSPTVPDVPPIAESVPGFEFHLWQALIVPTGVARPTMIRLNSDAVAALRHPDTKERLVSLGAEATPTSTQDADAHIRAEVQRIKVLKPVKPGSK